LDNFFLLFSLNKVFCFQFFLFFFLPLFLLSSTSNPPPSSHIQMIFWGNIPAFLLVLLSTKAIADDFSTPAFPSTEVVQSILINQNGQGSSTFQNIVDVSLSLGDESSDDDSSLECADIMNKTRSGTDQCSFAHDYCESDHFGISFEIMYYCSGTDYRPLVMIFIVFFLLYLVNLLATTADNYFVIQLEHLSAVLQLPDDVAGVTLLAFGNGAPDIFTAISGVGDSDFALALSDLLGGGMFINTVILGAVILVCKVEVDPKPFHRDFFMYFGTCVAIIVISMFETINIFEAIGFIVAYVAYVMYVVFGSESVKKTMEEEPENNYLRASSVAREVSVARDLAALPFIRNSKSVDNFLHRSGGLKGLQSLHNSMNNLAQGEDEHNAMMSSTEGIGYEGTIHAGFSFHALHDHGDVYQSSGGQSSSHQQLFPIIGLTDRPTFKSNSAFDVVVWYLEWPLSFLRHISIPPSDEAWDFKRRVLSSICPITGPQLFLLTTFGLDGFRGDMAGISPICFAIGTILGFLIFIFSNNVQKPIFFNGMVCYGFVMSIVWLDIIANEVVAILEFFGIVLSIPTSFMGLTVLAWGNSVGDFVADLATARAGAVKSALAAIFGSPLLSSLVGLGLALSLSISNDGPVISEVDGQNLIAMCFMMFTLISTFVVFFKYDYKPPKWFAYYLFLVYGAFMTASCLLQVSGIEWKL